MISQLFQPGSINIEYVFYRIYQALSGQGFSFSTTSDWQLKLAKYVLWTKGIMSLMTLVMSLIVFYLVYKIVKLRQEEDEATTRILEANLNPQPELTRNPRWEKIKAHIDSEHANDWKLAIIDADKMLDDLLIELKLSGESLGERLLSAKPGDVRTLNQAWEAHKVRNRIAHQTDFELTQREAKRVIGLFEEVFQEFGKV